MYLPLWGATMGSFEWKIHHTGSSGNCATIKVGGMVIMIDAGKSYKTILPKLDGVDFILYSHRHGDHLGKSAYKSIRLLHPNITTITNQDVSDFVQGLGYPEPDYIIKASDRLFLGDLTINVFENYHGANEDYVETNGYLFSYFDEHLLFATDLSTAIEYEEYLRKHNIKLDVCLLEANYNEDVLSFYTDWGYHNGYDLHTYGAVRHHSTGQYNNFVAEFLKPDGYARELHTSASFHDFEGLVRRDKKVTWEDVRAWQRLNEL